MKRAVDSMGGARRRRKALAAALAAVTVLPAAAQNAGRVPGMVGGTLLGKPQQGERGLADDAADVIRGVGRARAGKRELEGDLLSARLAFRGAKTEDERTRAAARLHEALDGKDAVFYILHLQFGTSAEARRAVDGMHQLTGGLPDGGVRDDAQAAYFAWVDAFRAELGLRSNNERLLHLTRESFLAAQSRAKPLHDTYVALRNAGEVRRAVASAEPASVWKTTGDAYVLAPQVNAAAAREVAAVAAGAQAAGPALARHEVSVFTPRFLNNLRQPGTGMVNAVLAERGAGQKVLRCFYGPVEIVGGHPQYRVYTFWHGTVPASFERMKNDPSGALGSAGPLDRLGQPRALAQCPATEDQVDATAVR